YSPIHQYGVRHTLSSTLLPYTTLFRSIALNHLQVNGEEEDLLALIAETIIPETDTPGARTVGAHHFTLVMVDDCLPKDQQLEYRSEEHTSELQSREKLVCRLLLEKKTE